MAAAKYSSQYISDRWVGSGNGAGVAEEAVGDEGNRGPAHQLLAASL